MRGKPARLAAFVSAFLVGSVPVLPSVARAWGPAGHQTVGRIAEKLLEGKPAAAHVKELLGSITLSQAAVWADCAKGVQFPGGPNGPTYSQDDAKFPQCAVFERAEGIAAMVDFVKRNGNNCQRVPGDEVCHRQYHYAGIAPQHDHYDSAFKGARNDDIVASITAAIAVLRGQAASAPYEIKDKKEALLLLAHYVGDLHQPLHIGALYLDPTGKRVNPDKGTFDPTTETRGGNQIDLIPCGSGNLHGATWDDIPADFSDENVDDAWIKNAKKVPKTSGKPGTWATAWANQTQKVAIQAFKGLTFSAKHNDRWSVILPGTYDAFLKKTKKEQLTRAGARLAQVLEAVWPQ